MFGGIEGTNKEILWARNNLASNQSLQKKKKKGIVA